MIIRNAAVIAIADSDLHPHLKARMEQRGVAIDEIERALNEGWEAEDAKPGTLGKVFVFPFAKQWEGSFFEQKEVSVYYKLVDERILLLTVKARYGKSFPGKGGNP